jgi:hypothetical protein
MNTDNHLRQKARNTLSRLLMDKRQPCVECGTPEGGKKPGKDYPYRGLGMCLRCYQRFAQERYRAMQKVAPTAPKKRRRGRRKRP